MKILHVNYIFPPKPNVADGITQVVHRQTKALAKKGHDVTVYASNALDLHGKARIEIENSPAYIDRVKIRYFPYLLRYNTIFFTPSIFYSVRDDIKKFDVIHIHDVRCLQCAIAAYHAGLFNIPIVFQPHGSFKSSSPSGRLRKLSRIFIDKLYAEKVFKKVSKMVALSYMEAEQYKAMGVPEEKIAIIPNGIDLSEYANLPAKRSFRKKFSVDDDKKIILYLGRIHKIKGLDILVRAYVYVVNKLGVNNVLLVIAGADDGYLGELEELLGQLRIADNVLLTGPLYGKDKLEAYVDADVFILPSRYETFPNVVLEAYACSKPVIASNVYGLRDLVIDGVTGFLVEQGNVKQMAHSILSLIGDDGRAEEMGLKGKQFVKENFTIEEVVHRIENLYREVVSSQPAIKAIQAIKNARYKSS